MQQSKIAINQVWPTTLYICDWAEQDSHGSHIVSHLKELAAGYSELIASGVAKSAKPAKGLIESPLDLFVTTKNPNLLALAGWISGCVRSAVSNVNGGQVPPERIQLEFSESWFHITNESGFHDAHTHGACSWCGIYYVVAGDAGEVTADGNDVAANGINRFYTPLASGGLVRDYGNAYLGRGFLDIQPLDGRLVIFPSYLLHSALPYLGKTDRMVIAFNTRSRVAPG